MNAALLSLDIPSLDIPSLDILYTLIPLSVVLIFLILVVLYWASRSGQFDNIDAEGERILDDDDRDDAIPGSAPPDAADAKANRSPR